MRKLLPCLTLLTMILLLGFPQVAFAQPQITQTSVVYTYGEQITFRLSLQSDQAVKKATIFFQADGDTHTNFGDAMIIPTGENLYELSYTHQIENYRLRAFSQVEYRVEVSLEDGAIYKSPPASFYYSDNRFEWQTQEEGPFIAHWYQGDMTLAQSVLDVAQAGMAKIQSLLALPAPASLDIYIYPDVNTMREVLNPSSADWVAGHADPDLGVVIVSLPSGPEQRLLTQQRIPHELMHIVLFQATGTGYTNLPVWLNEGLASLAELYTNPDYEFALENAVKADNLLPIESLCRTFPRDASNALLSYAQSASFTSYLHSTFGTSGLEKLVTTYANGLGCEQGFKTATGVELKQSERLWRRQALSENITLKAIENLAPWLVLLGAALAVPLILAVLRIRWRKGTKVESQ
ncbi:MAG: hypothetical protein JXB15_12675 [Anaerolineales bacterium]|nr:hypothetical protein [Anaerolineales bacterium]